MSTKTEILRQICKEQNIPYIEMQLCGDELRELNSAPQASVYVRMKSGYEERYENVKKVMTLAEKGKKLEWLAIQHGYDEVGSIPDLEWELIPLSDVNFWQRG